MLLFDFSVLVHVCIDFALLFFVFMFKFCGRRLFVFGVRLQCIYVFFGRVLDIMLLRGCEGIFCFLFGLFW